VLQGDKPVVLADLPSLALVDSVGHRAGASQRAIERRYIDRHGASGTGLRGLGRTEYEHLHQRLVLERAPQRVRWFERHRELVLLAGHVLAKNEFRTDLVGGDIDRFTLLGIRRA